MCGGEGEIRKKGHQIDLLDVVFYLEIIGTQDFEIMFMLNTLLSLI